MSNPNYQLFFLFDPRYLSPVLLTSSKHFAPVWSQVSFYCLINLKWTLCSCLFPNYISLLLSVPKFHLFASVCSQIQSLLLPDPKYVPISLQYNLKFQVFSCLIHITKYHLTKLDSSIPIYNFYPVPTSILYNPKSKLWNRDIPSY